MKRKNKISAMLIATIICLSLAACSSGGEEGESSQEESMPQISIDMSESAQTTAENTEEDTAENTSDTSETSPQTEKTEAAENTEETNPTENTETSIINTEATTTAAPETPPEVSPQPEAGANGITETAISMIGKPFFFGGADPETGFDNSGLMHYVLRANGLDCPRLTGDIAEWGEKVSYEEIQPGYLVFFEYEGSGKADFGGIYIGGGKMVVSTDEDKPVSEVDITTDYYKRTFRFGIKTA